MVWNISDATIAMGAIYNSYFETFSDKSVEDIVVF